MLSTSVFAWAQARSGLTTADFMATLTPEREEEIFQSYNEWRLSKGLKPVERAAQTVVAPPPRPPKAVNDFDVLLKTLAAEVEAQEEEEAEEIARTMAEIDAMEVPEEDAPMDDPEADDAPAPDPEPVRVEPPSIPADLDPSQYGALAARLGDGAVDAVTAAIRDAARRHRGTSALKAFLRYLNENRTEEEK